MAWTKKFKVEYKLCIDELARDLKISKALRSQSLMIMLSLTKKSNKAVYCIDAQKALIINKAANIIFSNLKTETSNTSDTSSETSETSDTSSEQASETSHTVTEQASETASEASNASSETRSAPKGGLDLAAIRNAKGKARKKKKGKTEGKKVKGKAKTIPSSKPDGSNNAQQKGIVLLQTDRQQLDKIPEKKMRTLDFAFQTAGKEYLVAAAPEVNLSKYINSSITNLIFGYTLKRFTKIRANPCINAGEGDKPNSKNLLLKYAIKINLNPVKEAKTKAPKTPIRCNTKGKKLKKPGKMKKKKKRNLNPKPPLKLKYQKYQLRKKIGYLICLYLITTICSLQENNLMPMTKTRTLNLFNCQASKKITLISQNLSLQ